VKNVNGSPLVLDHGLDAALYFERLGRANSPGVIRGPAMNWVACWMVRRFEHAARVLPSPLQLSHAVTIVEFAHVCRRITETARASGFGDHFRVRVGHRNAPRWRCCSSLPTVRCGSSTLWLLCVCRCASYLGFGRARRSLKPSSDGRHFTLRSRSVPRSSRDASASVYWIPC